MNDLKGEANDPIAVIVTVGTNRPGGGDGEVGSQYR